MRRRDGNKKRRVERQEQAVERQARYDARKALDGGTNATAAYLLGVDKANIDRIAPIGAVRLA